MLRIYGFCVVLALGITQGLSAEGEEFGGGGPPGTPFVNTADACFPDTITISNDALGVDRCGGLLSADEYETEETTGRVYMRWKVRGGTSGVVLGECTCLLRD